MPKDEKEKWRDKLRVTSKKAQRDAIADAKDIGGLTHREIGELVGLSTTRVKAIVAEVREERETS